MKRPDDAGDSLDGLVTRHDEPGRAEPFGELKLQLLQRLIEGEIDQSTYDLQKAELDRMEHDRGRADSSQPAPGAGRDSIGTWPTTDDVAVGFGRKSEHRVARRSFSRATEEPETKISVRYDTKRALDDRGAGCRIPKGWKG